VSHIVQLWGESSPLFPTTTLPGLRYRRLQWATSAEPMHTTCIWHDCAIAIFLSHVNKNIIHSFINVHPKLHVHAADAVHFGRICFYSRQRESRGKVVHPRLSVCVYMCVYLSHDRAKTAETTITKLSTWIVSPYSRVLATHLILVQKVKGQDHMVTKCKINISAERDRVAGVSLHSIEWPASSFVIDYSCYCLDKTTATGLGHFIYFFVDLWWYQHSSSVCMNLSPDSYKHSSYVGTIKNPQKNKME